MTNFWHNKSVYEITRDYLVANLDEYVGTQFINMDKIVDMTCKYVSVKENSDNFVGDYFVEAVEAINHFKPEGNFRITDYDHTANLMIKKAARELLPYCNTAQKYEDKYHIYTKEDIDSLKAELNSLSFNYKFQRSVDMPGESLEGFAYRYLFHVLPGLENCKVEIDQIPTILPLCPTFTVEEANAYIKRNFEEAMELLDDFVDSGYKVDFGNSPNMIQAIIHQKAKEILQENPMLVKLQDVDPFFDDDIVDKVTMDKKFLDDLTASLHKQQGDVLSSKVYSAPKDRTPPRTKNAKTYNPHKCEVRCEYFL